MRKIIAAINMTLDGVCDHTVLVPDEEIHEHYAHLLKDAGMILYGRTTYQLMKFWQTLVEKPSGEKTMDGFAACIDRIPKIVFSNTLTKQDLGWHSAELAGQSLDETVSALRQQPGKDILVGSRSLINQLMQLNLVDEYQLCIHPLVAGNGLRLFEANGRTMFRLVKTKTFAGGAVTLYYRPAAEK